MHLVLVVAAFGIAVLTAVRSTWSPCGRSMLSTITPIGERGRGASYRGSAAWFVTGAVLGGACLGGALAALAAIARLAGLGAHPPATVIGVLAAAGALVAAASDTRLGGVQLPFHRRQVNELWLDRFRPWVYGAGFGWQIGVGFATYVTSAGLYLLVLLAAVVGSPAEALAAGLLFGAVRGLAVLFGRRLTDPEALRRFHRRFDAAERPVHVVLVAGELAVAIAATAVLAPTAAGALAACVCAVAGIRLVLRRSRRKVARGGEMGAPAPAVRAVA